jgi:hypothetical protein
MQHRLPWHLLLSKLQRSSAARITGSELTEARADAGALVRSGVLTALSVEDTLVHPDCDCGAAPNLDLASRSADGLVGVACASEPACTDGWAWLPAREAEAYRVRAEAVLATLAAANGLEPTGVRCPPGCLALGVLRSGGHEFPVVWVRASPTAFEVTCRGIRAALRGDALVVLTAAPTKVTFAPETRIVVCEARPNAFGHLGLEALVQPLVAPEAQATAQSADRASVRIRFATVPGERHGVFINGHDYAGFRKSDLKFLRLLLLALARKLDPEGGWLDKAMFRDGDEKDRGLERLRDELSAHECPKLTPAERRALIKAQRGTGRVRLAVPAESIEIDRSVTALTLLIDSEAEKRALTPKQAIGRRNAEVLAKDCMRRLALLDEVQAGWARGAHA